MYFDKFRNIIHHFFPLFTLWVSSLSFTIFLYNDINNLSYLLLLCYALNSNFNTVLSYYNYYN